MSGSGLVIMSSLVTVVPVLVYIWILWVVDRYEKEPLSLLGSSLLGGAVIAPALTVLVERGLGLPVSVFPTLFQLYPVVQPNLAGAVIEELAKGVVVLGAYHFLRREFDDTLDGIVYGATVGAGFALAESIGFLRDVVPHAATTSFGAGFFLAIFVSGLTHCVFSGLFGASLGYVRETSTSGSARSWIPLAGLVTAVMYHLGYVAAGAAGMAGFTGVTAVLLGLARQAADWAGLVVLALVVLWAWSRERGILRWALADETASGVVTAEDLSALASGRVPWERHLREAIGELAFAKWRAARGLGGGDDVRRQRQRVLALRGMKGSGRP